jgi:predicted DNA-binding transcriptional regulator AlpA
MATTAELGAPSRRLIDAREVGRMLGCSWRTVYRLADRGAFPAGIKLSALRRWDSAELDAFIADGCKPPLKRQGGEPMSGPDPRHEGHREGERRKDAAHRLLEARREVLVRRARRGLLSYLLCAGTATADDVADLIGSMPPDIDQRYLGTVPGPLALAGIIRVAGYTKSCPPSRHASILTRWELADRAAALAWLARNPELPDLPEADADAAGPRPSEPAPPSPSTQMMLY